MPILVIIHICCNLECWFLKYLSDQTMDKILPNDSTLISSRSRVLFANCLKCSSKASNVFTKII